VLGQATAKAPSRFEREGKMGTCGEKRDEGGAGETERFLPNQDGQSQETLGKEQSQAKRVLPKPRKGGVWRKKVQKA